MALKKDPNLATVTQLGWELCTGREPQFSTNFREAQVFHAFDALSSLSSAVSQGNIEVILDASKNSDDNYRRP